MKAIIKYTTQREKIYSEIVEGFDQEEIIEEFEANHDDAEDRTEIEKVIDITKESKIVDLAVGHYINKLFSDLARTLKLESGDISPSEKARLDEIQEDLKAFAINWILGNQDEK